MVVLQGNRPDGVHSGVYMAEVGAGAVSCFTVTVRSPRDERTSMTAPPLERPEREILVCGTLVADIRVRPFRPVLAHEHAARHHVESVHLAAGGIVANTGIALARLGFAVAGITRVGTDDIGDVLLASLARRGLDVSGILRMTDVPTQPVLVCIDEQGERTFHIADGATLRFGEDDFRRELPRIQRAGAVLIGYLGEMPCLDPHLPAVLAWLRRETDALIVLESAGGQSAQRAMIASCLQNVDVFFPSWQEARDLTGARSPEAALRRLAEMNPRAILGVKLGAQGCIVRDGDSQRKIAAHQVQVIDATGAGDAFLAAFVAGLLRSQPLEECAKLGNAAGALSVSAADSHTALPSFDVLARLAHRLQQGEALQEIHQIAH